MVSAQIKKAAFSETLSGQREYGNQSMVKETPKSSTMKSQVYAWPGVFMVEVKHVRRSLGVGGLSKRAQEVLTRFAARSTLSTQWRGPLPHEGQDTICIPQKELAIELGCSRWTIGRAIKKLKDAGLLVETGRDKQSRCKTYALQAPSPLSGEGLGVRFPQEPTPQGLVQLENYRHLFECNLGNWPDWEKHYAAVTWELKDEYCIHKLFRQTFDRLYEIRAQDTSFTPLVSCDSA